MAGVAFIHGSIEGVSEAITALERIKSKVDEATLKATVTSGQILQRAAVDNFHGSHAPGEWHIGGSAPNTVSGNLQRSIKSWPPVSMGPAHYSVQVNPTAIYSRVIELGAHISAKHAEFLSWVGRRADGTWGLIQKRSVTIGPHPYLRPAVESMPPKMEQIFGDAWGDAWSV